MNTQVNKQELIDWISGLTDTAMLQNIQSLKNSTEGKDWWDEISEAEKESIKRGEEDIKAGRVHSSEEFWKMLETRKNSKFKTIYSFEFRSFEFRISRSHRKRFLLFKVEQQF